MLGSPWPIARAWAWAAERLADGVACLAERRTMFVVGDALTVVGPANQSKQSRRISTVTDVQLHQLNPSESVGLSEGWAYREKKALVLCLVPGFCESPSCMRHAMLLQDICCPVVGLHLFLLSVFGGFGLKNDLELCL
jgi:hypothetical protein